MLFRFKDGGFQRMGLGIDNQQSVFLVDSKNPVSNPDHRTDLSTVQTAGSILSPGNSLPDFHLVNIIQKNTVAGSYILCARLPEDKSAIGYGFTLGVLGDIFELLDHLHGLGIAYGKSASGDFCPGIALLLRDKVEFIA